MYKEEKKENFYNENYFNVYNKFKLKFNIKNKYKNAIFLNIILKKNLKYINNKFAIIK